VEKNFTVEQMKSALLAVRGIISEPQMSMLRAHYMRRELSMERIASFGGYGNYGAANLQYGRLCGWLAKQLGFVHRSKTYTIATGAERDSKGHFQWKLDDIVAKALKKTGWFKDVEREKPKPGSIESSDDAEGEREAIIKARIGQGRFRIDVIALWGSCAVTGCSVSKVLVASHIVPWALCTNNKEKLDPFNGLLLTPNLDKLFDLFLIAFDDAGTILLSKELGAKQIAILGVNEKSKLRFVRPAMKPYLRRHREIFRRRS
jgi:hypothetical protein